MFEYMFNPEQEMIDTRVAAIKMYQSGKISYDRWQKIDGEAIARYYDRVQCGLSEDSEADIERQINTIAKGIHSNLENHPQLKDLPGDLKSKAIADIAKNQIGDELISNAVSRIANQSNSDDKKWFGIF
jgi:hypothetical protein